ncbi:MAG: stage IV sporulation protein A, partial [Clostridium celatum]|nr:stage IV sporulation protein A [Clostridium celatum]
VEITIDEDIRLKVRMVDCVGYIVKGALGFSEDDAPKMVNTPWFEDEIPFEAAAEIGTRKVITDHSTVGLVVTTDGSITGINREDYVEAEERVVEELKAINKPFIVVLNTKNINSPETDALKDELEKKYDVEVQVMDVFNMTEKDIEKLFKNVLKEFPVKEINIDMPEWVECLEPDHWLKKEFFKIIKGMCQNVDKIRDIKPAFYDAKENQNLSASDLNEINLGEGTANILLKPSETIFYKVLSENCGVDVSNESDLISLVKELNIAKVEYDKIKDALVDVKETGYGLVAPQLSEMKFEEPEIVKQGSKFGVKLKASAPSLHFIKADIKTEISPIMGSEKESEELVKALMEQFD